MSRPDEHIFQHPKTHVFWFRRVIPPRLRPVMPDVVDLFPAGPTRVQFTRTLATKDRRRANAAALPLKQAVNAAFADAELRQFNAPPLDRRAAYQADAAEAPLRSALAEASGQLGTGTPWPAHGDATLAGALSSQGLPLYWP